MFNRFSIKSNKYNESLAKLRWPQFLIIISKEIS